MAQAMQSHQEAAARGVIPWTPASVAATTAWVSGDAINPYWNMDSMPLATGRGEL